MAVIPQDPYIIEDSLKKNIDLRGKFSYKEIIEVLKKSLVWNCNMFDKAFKVKQNSIDMNRFTEDDKKLNFLITDNGDNLSIGQKQLICIARTILKNPRILLMDEATANIDPKTDKMI